MLAVIKTGGKQYLVTPNQKLKVERLKTEGDTIEFTEVLLIEKSDKVEIGKPFIKGAVVTAKVLAEGKGKKVTGIQYKPKTRSSITKGHRQYYTQVEITSIEIK